MHGGASSLDFHENFAQAPQYRGECKCSSSLCAFFPTSQKRKCCTDSTDLFSRKAVEWMHNTTQAGAETGLFTYLSFQAVHGPIEAPPGSFEGCEDIVEQTRATYCLMMQSLDQGIANVTAAYESANLFDSTVWLFLAGERLIMRLLCAPCSF